MSYIFRENRRKKGAAKEGEENTRANRDGVGFGQANANLYHKNHIYQRCEDRAHARWWVYKHTSPKLLELITLIGVRGLYTGLTASVFRQMTYSVTRLGVYDLMKNTMSNNGAKKLRTGDMVICASVAGALGGVAGNPADIILVRYIVLGSNQAVLLMNCFCRHRMVADPTKPAENQMHYRNAIHGIYKMVSNEGVASLARGLAPNTVRVFLNFFGGISTNCLTIPTADPSHPHERLSACFLRFLQGAHSRREPHGERHASSLCLFCLVRYRCYHHLCTCGCGEEQNYEHEGWSWWPWACRLVVGEPEARGAKILV